MRLTSVVLTSWISSITSKISWIAGWPWSNHVCVCVWVCVCVCLCAIWYMGRKNKYWDFLSGNFVLAWRSHGKIMELFSEIFVGTLMGGFVFMMTSSNGNIFRVTDPLCGEFTGHRWIPSQRPVTQSFDVFFDLSLNKRLSKQPRRRWFETPSRPLWRHSNVKYHRNPVIWRCNISILKP